MTTRRLALVAAALWFAAETACADIGAFAIESLYSNADGTAQFVVLRETQGLPGSSAWSGRTLRVTRPGVTRTFTFGADLPSAATAHARVLLATAGVGLAGAVAPDFVLPDRFLPTDGATLDFAGVDQVTYASLPTDGVNAITRLGFPTPNSAANFAGATAALPATPVTAIEYRNGALDHYFVSNLAPDLDALDSGRIAGWTRTGKSFKVFPTQASGGGGVSPVCRFYIPPEHGNSHFFSASPAECATVLQKAGSDADYSGYVLETAQAFFAALPDPATGACATGAIPLYRLWNHRADANHRYTTDAAVKAQMVAAGYIPEGYGPDAVAMCVPPGNALLKLTAGLAAPYGALVSDATNTPAVPYAHLTSVTDNINAGPRRGPGEAIAFGIDRPPALVAATWLAGAADQWITVPFAARIDVPVTVWIVAPPFAANQQAALTWWQTAETLFRAERMGVRMGVFEVVDATAAAVAWNAFTCGTGNANVAALQAAVGARPGRVNVYVLAVVDGSTARGNSCTVGGAFVAIAAGSGAELLAHELGHAYALEHVDDLVADFDATNIMHSASNVRAFLTEGQTFRAHLRSASALNSVYGARSGLPVRDCDRDTPATGCPPLRTRLWADGAYPAN